MTTSHDEDEETARMVLSVLKEIRRYQLGDKEPFPVLAPREVPSVASIRHRLMADRIGWLGHPPSTAHKDHLFDDECALCRAGDKPDALGVLIAAVLLAVEAA